VPTELLIRLGGITDADRQADPGESTDSGTRPPDPSAVLSLTLLLRKVSSRHLHGAAALPQLVTLLDDWLDSLPSLTALSSVAEDQRSSIYGQLVGQCARHAVWWLQHCNGAKLLRTGACWL
jgi:hypothetical protein